MVLSPVLSQAIARVLQPIPLRRLDDGAAASWTPALWFLANEQGIWLDPSDFTRYMGELGPELVSNPGPFTATTGWQGNQGTVSVVGGKLRVSASLAAGSYVSGYVNLTGLTPGKSYRVYGKTAPGTITSTGNGAYLAGPGSTNGSSSTGDPKFGSSYIQIADADGSVWFALFGTSAGVGSYFDIETLSVRELTAINTATMFQGSAGTTPVTAVEQPVGLSLDKRVPQVIGPELSADVDLDNAAQWIKGTGWTVSGGKATHTGATSSYLSSLFQPVVGQWYRFRVVTGAVDAGTVLVAYAGNSDHTFVMQTANTTYDFYLCGTGTFLGFAIYGSTGAGKIAEVLSFSFKTVTGNHVRQDTSAARSVLRTSGGVHYEDRDGVDDSSLAVVSGGATTAALIIMGFRTDAIGAAQTLFSDRSGNTGLKLEITAGGNIAFSGGNGASINTATGAAVTANTDYVVTAKYDGANLSVQLNRGSATTAACTLSAGTAAITLGKDNGAATGYHNGRQHQLVYIKNVAKSAGEIASAQDFVAAKTGVTL